MGKTLRIDIEADRINAVLPSGEQQSLKRKDSLAETLQDCRGTFSAEGNGIGRLCISSPAVFDTLVNSRDCKTALLLIGYGDDLVKTLERDAPVDYVRSIRGGHRVSGTALESLDTDALTGSVQELSPVVTDFIVSGYAGVSNREHEEEAKRLITGITDTTVHCAAEFSSQYHALHRAHTAVCSVKAEHTLINFSRQLRMNLPSPFEGTELRAVDNTGIEIPFAAWVRQPLSCIQGFLAARLKEWRGRGKGGFLFLITDHYTLAGYLSDSGLQETEKIILPFGMHAQQPGLSTCLIPFGRNSAVTAGRTGSPGFDGTALPLSRALSKYKSLSSYLEQTPEMQVRFMEEGTGIYTADRVFRSFDEIDERELSIVNSCTERFTNLGQLSKETGYPEGCIHAVLQDLQQRGIVERIGVTLHDILSSDSPDFPAGAVRRYIDGLRSKGIHAAASRIAESLGCSEKNRTVLFGSGREQRELEETTARILAVPYRETENHIERKTI